MRSRPVPPNTIAPKRPLPIGNACFSQLVAGSVNQILSPPGASVAADGEDAALSAAPGTAGSQAARPSAKASRPTNRMRIMKARVSQARPIVKLVRTRFGTSFTLLHCPLTLPQWLA